ncbi:MAG TPA: choice-of-anchor Q domain-containing protein, partial [Pseudomonadales bacterium]|nr:choice-of-anchor Q domain-containing protein [Pseudomonadales bacterium]
PSRALAIDGNHLDRVFLHYGSGSFLLRDVTVRNGRNRATGTHLGVGGCIASAGYLTLDHSTVTGCYAGGEGAYGGAIYAYSLILSSSTLSHNIAYGVHIDALDVAAFGGAAFVYQIDFVASTITQNIAHHQVRPTRNGYDFGGGIATVRGGLVINTTIDSNYAYGRGGGLATFADVLISNSTISGNSAPHTGGGGLFIRYPALLDARNSTIADNTGRSGGGVLFTSSAAALESTIVSGNHASSGADMDGSQPVAIIGASDLVSTISPRISLPAGTLRGDANLMPLDNNGGPTRTHALRPGSAAVDAGNNASQLASDQRGQGFLRVIGPAADIGAFELGAGAQDSGRIPVPALSEGVAAVMFTLLAFAGLRTLRRRMDRCGAGHADRNAFLIRD